MPTGSYLPRLTGTEYEDAQARMSWDRTRPILIGYGPVECSTSISLESYPSVIWDTNLYYQHLGVHPKASRKELREAYQAMQGQESPRLTMIMKCLLNDETRLAYDTTKLGSVYFDDEVRARIKKDILRQSEKLLEEHGIDMTPDEIATEIEEMVAEEERVAALPTARQHWSYYVWQTQCDDADRLNAWRSMVIAKLHELVEGDIPLRTLSFGFHEASDDPHSVRMVGERMVSFIGSEIEPTDDLGESAASSILQRVTKEQA